MCSAAQQCFKTKRDQGRGFPKPQQNAHSVTTSQDRRMLKSQIARARGRASPLATGAVHATPRRATTR